MRVDFPKDELQSLKTVFIYATIAEPDEIPLSAVFHIGLHCLPKYLKVCMYLNLGNCDVAVQYTHKKNLHDLFAPGYLSSDGADKKSSKQTFDHFALAQTTKESSGPAIVISWVIRVLSIWGRVWVSLHSVHRVHRVHWVHVMVSCPIIGIEVGIVQILTTVSWV